MSSESTIALSPEEPEGPACFPDVVFPAGNSDFRAVRNRCARACREFNNTPDDADPEERSRKWLDIVRPDRDRSEDGVLAVTHDQTFANPGLKAKTPFVKPPVYIDYGVRLHVGGSTFINRNCYIMDTPVADIVIGEGCNIGPNCSIVGVTHPVRLDERLEKHSIGQPVTIGNDVWIGANVTICGGVTIGDGAVIGACSLVTRHVPPLTLAVGAPARVVAALADLKPVVPRAAATARTLAEALALANRLPPRRRAAGRGPAGPSFGGDGCGAGAEEAGAAAVVGGVAGGCLLEDEDEDEDGDGRHGEEVEGGVEGQGRRRRKRRYFDLPERSPLPPPESPLLSLPLPSRPRSPFSVGPTAVGSGSGVARETTDAESDEEGEAEEGRSLLRGGRGRPRYRPRRRCGRRSELVDAAAVGAVLVALLMAFFFAGVYLGASKTPSARDPRLGRY